METNNANLYLDPCLEPLVVGQDGGHDGGQGGGHTQTSSPPLGCIKHVSDGASEY